MRYFWIILICALPCVTAALAQPQQSENFRITKSVLDAGGGASASESFRLYSAFGQPTPIGYQSSVNFGLWAGYLSPGAAISPLSPIQALVIQELQPSIKLAWPRAAGANAYKIYRDINALFTPGPGNYLAATADTYYVDINVVPQPQITHYYIVTASNDPAAATANVPTDFFKPEQPLNSVKAAPESAKPR